MAMGVNTGGSTHTSQYKLAGQESVEGCLWKPSLISSHFGRRGIGSKTYSRAMTILTARQEAETL